VAFKKKKNEMMDLRDIYIPTGLNQELMTKEREN